jgi:hypothetical protein
MIGISIGLTKHLDVLDFASKSVLPAINFLRSSTYSSTVQPGPFVHLRSLDAMKSRDGQGLRQDRWPPQMFCRRWEEPRPRFHIPSRPASEELAQLYAQAAPTIPNDTKFQR